MTWMQFETG